MIDNSNAREKDKSTHKSRREKLQISQIKILQKTCIHIIFHFLI